MARVARFPTVEHETKFVFEAVRLRAVLCALRSRAAPDPDHPVGILSSVYFDTPDRRLLGEKEASEYHKVKLRVRWYADPGEGGPRGAAWIEVKRKLGARRGKEREEAGLSARETAALPLDHPRWRRLVHARAWMLPAPLLPVMEIRYARRRFVHPTTGTRIALDTDIRVARSNPALAPRPHPWPLTLAVLEVKGQIRELPPDLHGLLAHGLRKASFSKYLACHRWLERRCG